MINKCKGFLNNIWLIKKVLININNKNFMLRNGHEPVLMQLMNIGEILKSERIFAMAWPLNDPLMTNIRMTLQINMSMILTSHLLI
jgi:hypothetical protein